MKIFTIAASGSLLGALVAGCASLSGGTADYDKAAAGALRSSFRAEGIAGLDRLDQDPIQKACSTGENISDAQRKAIESAALATVKYPADGKFLGDWKEGEKQAQSGRGMTWTDKPGQVNGGNCYNCHQITRQEISFGTIGPSLLGYGKLRGNSAEIQRYTWAKMWNPHAFNACTNMPRFGDKGVLTEQQIKDIMALLLDPESPVNK